MKKALKLLSILLVVVMLCGCESAAPKEKIVKCSIDKVDTANGYELKSSYVVYAKGDVVNKVKTTEIATSDADSILGYFETALNSTYEKYSNQYGGYSYKVTKEGNKVIADVTIDYTKMDLDKFTKDNPSIKAAMTNDNKLTLEGVKSMYKALGATCED